MQTIPTQEYATGLTVEGLASVIFPYGTQKRMMAMFAAYFDESGTHADSPFVAVAGFLASDSQWKKLSRSWKKVLGDIGVKYFHMTDFLTGKGEYAEIYAALSEEQKEKIVERLFNAIRRNTPIPIAAGVDKADYAKVALRNRYQRAPTNPYVFCALMCMCLQQVAEWADKVRHGEPIAYVFESGAVGCGEINAQACSIQRDAQRKARYRIGSLTFADKGDFPPLQAADVFAHRVFRVGQEHSRRKSGQIGKPKPSINASLERLFQGSPDRGFYSRLYDKKNLADVKW